MSYSNYFLADFEPVFQGILEARGLEPKRLELEVIDEEPENYSVFESADVKDVLGQLSSELNFLTIYTDRAAYFEEFAEIMYEENGLVVMFFSKKELLRGKEPLFWKKAWSAAEGKWTEKLVLDFEWKGECYQTQIRQGKHYIPIHKKPWKMAENLDIIVPFGYNTVIVKSIQKGRQKPVRDRFEEAFYKE